MKQSTFIDTLVKDLSSQLGRVNDQERSSYQTQTQNLNPQKQAANYKSIYSQDFFEFYLKDLEFSPQQFVDALNNDKRLIEFLYGYYTSYISNRREFQDLFEDSLKQNSKLFLVALKECLESHLYPYHAFEKDPENKEIAAQIERNTEDFKKLLQLGELHNHFRNIPKEALYTKNTQYKNLMQDKGLFDNEVFDEKKLISLFEEGIGIQSRYRSINLDKVTEYCIFHMKDIVEKFDTPGSFNAWAATYVNTKKNEKGETIVHVSEKNFFSLITSEFNKEIQSYQDKFIDQWTESMSFRQGITLGYSRNLSFLKFHPHQISTFLSKLTEHEKIELMERGMRDYDFTRSSGDFKNFITDIPLENSSPIYHASVIEKLIDFRKSISNSDDTFADNAFFSVAINYLVAQSLKLINNSSLPDDDKAQAKKDVLNVYAKNDDIIVSMIYDDDKAISKNIHNLENNIKELRLHSKELGLSSDFFNILESKASDKLEIYKLKSFDNNYSSRISDGLQNCISVVSALGIYSALDKLNLIGLKFTKEIRSYKNKKTTTKYLSDYPAVFEMVEETKDKGILSWIFQEKHIPVLKDEALYKNKNIIEHFSIADDASKSSESNIEKIFEVIMENKQVFKELVLSKKKIMKAVQGLDNNFIQTSLDFVALDNSLAKNEEPAVKKVSNKL